MPCLLVVLCSKFNALCPEFTIYWKKNHYSLSYIEIISNFVPINIIVGRSLT